MLKITLTLFVFISVVITFSGCSSRAWYEGLRNIERQNCYKIERTTERLECLEKVDDISYDQYQKEREEPQKQ